MKIIDHSIPKPCPTQVLNEVADALGVALEIYERNREECCVPIFYRYYVTLGGIEIKKGCILCGAFGDGHTKQEAVDDLCANLNHALVVKNAYSTTLRIELQLGRVAPYKLPGDSNDNCH